MQLPALVEEPDPFKRFLWERFGEDVTSLEIGPNPQDQEVFVPCMSPNPMPLDMVVPGPVGQALFICQLEGSIVIFKDS